jgi:hypothetical protein
MHHGVARLFNASARLRIRPPTDLDLPAYFPRRNRSALRTSAQYCSHPTYREKMDALKDAPVVVNKKPQRADATWQLRHLQGTLPIPHTRTMLYQQLKSRLETDHKISLVALINYHDVHKKHQSTHSYNLLIQHALRHRNPNHAFQLSQMLHVSRIPPSWDTCKLWIRLYVRAGRVMFAYRFLSRLVGGMLDRVPITIWQEFLAVPSWRSVGRRPKSPPSFQENDALGEVRRHAEAVAPSDSLGSVLRYFRMLVARFTWDGRIRQAIEVVGELLKELPKTMKDADTALLLTVIHQILGHARVDTASHRLCGQSLDSFLIRRPTLRYNAETLFLLLRSLGRTKHCGSRAFQLYCSWIAVYGSVIESSEVLRRIARYSLVEGRTDIAIIMRNRRDIHNRIGQTIRAFDDQLGQRRMREIYPGAGRERRLWREIEQRIAKEVGLDGSPAESPHSRVSLQRLSSQLDEAFRAYARRTTMTQNMDVRSTTCNNYNQDALQ